MAMYQSMQRVRFNRHAKEWAVRSGAITEDIITNFTFVNARLIRVCPTCADISDTPYALNEEQAVLARPCRKCGYHFPMTAETSSSTAVFKDVECLVDGAAAPNACE